jgi:hypothetical protein
MDLDGNALLASLGISVVGLAIFVYGRKQGRFPHLVAGVALMAYPYFVSNVPLMLGIAVALLAGLWTVVRLGG